MSRRNERYHHLFATSISPLPPSTVHSEDEEGNNTFTNIASQLRPPLNDPSNLISDNMTSLPITSQPTIYATPKQLQAIQVHNALSKIGPENLPSDDNYTLCSSEIKTRLDSWYCAKYLKNDDIKDDEGSIIHEVAKKYRWIPRIGLNLKQKITSYSNTGPKTDSLPANLWAAVVEHHSGRSTELRLLYEKALNLITQSASTPLPTHLENFQAAVTKFRGAGGVISEDDLGQELLISLKAAHFQNG
ncbi:hypothetical protein CROQUDRAFT_136462 [Cronartium quercuum f. sp. fusiforme G11]|uniref:Uncharacterized protein n=1 Tax=Cronartium quercuum f. sp. fusiforme G11 TaxID=708437 RepID=A0A9P6N6W3_9BASI|nr:hypothetical protein CROQUDRAFT_136462 [Cronartium quercuum f. sp. fusiforme G11]